MSLQAPANPGYLSGDPRLKLRWIQEYLEEAMHVEGESHAGIEVDWGHHLQECMHLQAGYNTRVKVDWGHHLLD